MLSAAFLRGNGVIHRTQKVIQAYDNGHVGRPCEVSLAPPYPELFASYGDSAVTRTSGRGHVVEAKTNVIEVSGFSIRVSKETLQERYYIVDFDRQCLSINVCHPSITHMYINPPLLSKSYFYSDVQKRPLSYTLLSLHQ